MKNKKRGIYKPKPENEKKLLIFLSKKNELDTSNTTK
jgi:hypothetical protein